MELEIQWNMCQHSDHHKQEKDRHIPFRFPCVLLYSLKEAVHLSNALVKQELSAVGKARNKHRKDRADGFCQ